jgi:hypothetical protein
MRSMESLTPLARHARAAPAVCLINGPCGVSSTLVF